ncbi:MAG TPA: PIG-L family deacetylase, partial [Thermoanaerobaculia bacterium]|nr:PIG-L family deacetylase [Thermoanaerobaculia bacterium]
MRSRHTLRPAPMKKMKKTLLAVLAALACLTAGDSLAVNPPGTALPPPSTGGIAALDLLLAKLATHRRLLVIAAHPDDEDTALLTLVARGQGGEAAYLSLSRGDGGQNLIGPELFEGLGVLRTRELDAARRMDGARQYFTRAYDFGFSKNVEEAFRLWPRQEVLKDAVRIIRRFRPQVIDQIFSGTPRDGHGQHQESALIAREAFDAAGDPAAFPELASEGLTPWKALALYRSTRFLDRDSSTVVMPTSGLENISGRSYQQIAVASRSLHRSQGTGALQAIGPNETRAAWVAGAGGPEVKDLFGAVDTSLAAIAGEVQDPERRRKVGDRLRTAQKLAEETRRQLSTIAASEAVTPLAAILEELRAARALTEPIEKNPAAAMLLEEKIRAAEGALAVAAGAMTDALAERETALPGESVSVSVSAWNAGGKPLEVRRVELVTPAGWRVPAAETPGKNLEAGKLEEWKLSASPPPDAPPTVPYFLRRPLSGALYDWSQAPPPVRGEPFEPPLLSAVVTLAVNGTPFRVAREVTYRYRDEAFGEVRRAVRVVPRVELTVEPDLLVWPVSRKEPRSLDVTIASNATEEITGSVIVEPPPGWPAVTEKRFVLKKRGDRAFVRLDLSLPAQPKTGRWPVSVRAALAGGEKLDQRIELIDYEHIRPTPMPRSSAVSLTSLDLRLPPLKRVGYVRGASDRVPEALKAVGVPIEEISARELQHGDLSRYDAIVVGPRAYETEPALVASNERLLDYVRGGGLAIVQYQQPVFSEGHFAPEKLEITRPFERVTDETAPVKELDSAHPILTTPNRIGDADWDGWVQERGLYFANTWAPAYTPLLGMADPGEPERRGSLL